MAHRFKPGDVCVIVNDGKIDACWLRYVGTECEVLACVFGELPSHYDYRIALCDGIRVFCSEPQLDRKPPKEQTVPWSECVFRPKAITLEPTELLISDAFEVVTERIAVDQPLEYYLMMNSPASQMIAPANPLAMVGEYRAAVNGSGESHG